MTYRLSDRDCNELVVNTCTTTAFHIEFVFLDPAEVPMCEISLACDNLLCDGHGRPPTPVLEIDVQSKSSKTWIKYARTEVVEVTAEKNTRTILS